MILKYSASLKQIYTIAGVETIYGHYDGYPIKSRFKYPFSLCLDNEEGNLYISDSGNHCIRKISYVSTPTRNKLKHDFTKLYLSKGKLHTEILNIRCPSLLLI